jgi:hypothetical protein
MLRPIASRDYSGVDWIEISGDEQRLRDRIGTADVPVRITPAPPRITALGIATSADHPGEMAFRG